MGMRIMVQEESMEVEGWVAMERYGQGIGLNVPKVRGAGALASSEGRNRNFVQEVGSEWLVLLGMKNGDCSGPKTLLCFG